MVFPPIREKLVRWIRRVRVRRCPSPFVIVFRERSGSTYLASLLDGHRHVTCRGEDFHGEFIGDIDERGARRELANWKRRILAFDGTFLNRNDSNSAVGHFHDIFSFPSHACGFKLKYPRQFDLYPEVISEMKELGNRLKLIVLSRKNLLKQAVSRQNFERIQSQFGCANLPAVREAATDSLGRLELNIRNAIQYARNSAVEQAGLVEMANQLHSSVGCPLFSTNYEDLLTQRLATLHEIFKFLEVDPQLDVPSANVRKATPNKLMDAILNFEEFADAVRKTEFREMLDED